MAITAKRAKKLAAIAEDLIYTTNDVLDDLEFGLGDETATKKDREEYEAELRDDFASVTAHYNLLSASLTKLGVI